MVTSAREYFALYHQVTSGNAPDLAVLLPSEENIYVVDLDTRTIEAPEFIGVTKEQRAEVIYFAMDRYYDNIDLARSIGVIEYINADGEPYIYGIPFYDIETLNSSYGEFVDSSIYKKIKKGRNQILFPWVIGSEATKSAGEVRFSMSFYYLNKTAEELSAEGSDANVEFLLRLNLLPATTIVQQGIEIDPNLEELEAAVDVSTFLELLNRYNELNAEYSLFWDESADDITQHPNSPVGPYAIRVRTNAPVDEDDG